MAKPLSPKNFLVRPRGYRKPARFFLDPTHHLNIGLTGYWPLGGNLGGAGAEPDVSGLKNHADANAAQTNSASHHGGIASSLDGSTQWFNAGPRSVWDAIPGSWCIWIKTSSLNGGWPVYMTRGNPSGTTNGVNLFIDNGTSKVRCQIKNNSGTSADLTGGSVITDGNWHFICVTFTQTGACTLYIDGVSVASATASPTWSFGSNDLTFGRTGDAFWKMFLGSLADVRVYNRLLTPEEITLLYTEPYAGISEFPASLVGVASSVAYTLTAAVGSFVLSGQAAILQRLVSLVSSFGSFALSGQSAAFAIARKIVADAGSFALTGQAATLPIARKIIAASGAFALSGQAALLAVTTNINNLFTGYFAVTGGDAEMDSTTHWTNQDCTDSPWTHDECDCH